MLNEIPVLDKGYVALFSCSIKRDEMFALKRDFFKDKWDHRLFDVPTIHLKIRCPLFVRMSFPEFGLSYIVDRSQNKIEAYIPTIADIQSVNLETSVSIQDSIERTTEALLINQVAYQLEKCDPFVSQVLYPISVYNVLIVSGTINQWLGYIRQENLPSPIESYRKTIEAAVLAEYDFLKEILNGDEQGKIYGD